MSFLQDFFGIYGEARNTAVCCPFPHYTANGIPYMEHNPSAHVDVADGLFHCKACNRGYNEIGFIKEYFGCSTFDAKRINRLFETDETKFDWDAEPLTEQSKETALSLGISEEIINEIGIKTTKGTEDRISYPVLMYGHIVDVRQYNKDQKPKIKSRRNAVAGLIIPFDLWRITEPAKLTLICAGEKDMAVARSNGFTNAITLTGGENTLPKTPELFRDREVAIVYDNDEAGKHGAIKLALYLYPYTKHIRVVTNFHEVCCEDKEDITDFFVKYKKTKEDLIQYIESTEYYIPSESDVQTQFPIVDLITASRPENINKMLRSNVQVVAVSESSYSAPVEISAEKFKETEDRKGNFFRQGTFLEWSLEDKNLIDILHLIDNNFKESEIQKNIRDLMKIPQIEKCMRIQSEKIATVYKAYVTDMFETSNADAQPMEFTAYSIGYKLESGKKYLITYKLVPHPYKGQQLTMLITGAVQANDSVSNFHIDDVTKGQLQQFINLDGTVEQKIHTLAEKVKGLLGYDGNDTLITAIDLAYHSALQFNFGNFKNVRGYLDTFIVGESRVGKSSTAECLRTTYELGVFTSLAGNSATIPGLVGGSNKVGGNYQTRAGVIPQNHKGLIIFEEFGKSKQDVITELTDIRSSNEVRITRVSGTVTLPAMVRMIALTNVKTSKGVIKSIASYPNGISVVTELIGTAEDIARYDLIVVLADKGNSEIDPFWEPEKPLDKEVYQTRIRWIWSRTTDQIIINKDIGLYIMQKANELNKIYDCHIKIFGTEAWKKIARLAVAVAGYLVSTDESFENIIVKKEHVDFAIAFMISLYDNSTFKLKEYVEHERKYSTIDEEGIKNLQDIYNMYPALILQLEQSADTSKQTLQAVTGLNNDDINKALNRLTQGLFIRFSNYEIIPTERFRLGVARLDRRTIPKRLGE